MQIDLPLEGKRATDSYFLPKRLIPTPFRDQKEEQIQELMRSLSDLILGFSHQRNFNFPANLNGLSILNLCENSVRDSFVLSALVGDSGKVVGIHTDESEIEKAHEALPEHQEILGFKNSNLEFFESQLEKIHELHFQDEEFDLIITHQNLAQASTQKSVLAECHRSLREGGEFVLNEVFCDRRLSDICKANLLETHPELVHSFYLPDFLEMSAEAGFPDPRLYAFSLIPLEDKTHHEEVGAATFYRASFRLFKLKDLEKNAEDYGQMLRYNGGVQGMEELFYLDHMHQFEKGKWQPVSGNSYLILNQSRFEHHFDFAGDFEQHFGFFKSGG